MLEVLEARVRRSLASIIDTAEALHTLTEGNRCGMSKFCFPKVMSRHFTWHGIVGQSSLLEEEGGGVEEVSRIPIHQTHLNAGC